MDLSGIDDATVNLVIELQLEDIASLTASSKGKHRQGESPDTECAISSYKTELESYASLVSDASMCRSIAQAVIRDGSLIHQEQSREAQAAHDREVALNLSHNRQAASTDTPKREEGPDEELLDKLKALYVRCPEEDPPNAAESSAWAASRHDAESQEPRRECIGCGDEYYFYDLARCPCSHEYCRDCLMRLVSASTIDESLYPPRCCNQEISVDSNRLFLPSELVEEFQRRKVELDTVNRTYCFDLRCSAFIPMEAIKGDTGQCPQCSKHTCTICKGESHEGDCPEDHATQDVLRLAKEEDWQRCSSCRSMVELELGCNHITCRCGAEFCYACGRPWKTCPCRQWDENRLLARANVIVDRNAPNRPFNEGRRAELVERVRANLIANHECRHAVWRSRRGAHRCEECHDQLPTYIYECVRCHIMVCRRCRYNRL